MLNYLEVLKKIENKENHLLIGNGFNRGLGINTSYKAIFQKMIDNNSIYNEAVSLVENCNFDLESFIGLLELEINSENLFLKNFLHNKIKLDFMQATHEIVKSEIKNVYSESNEGVYLLFRQFTSFFTLNYDSFLYLLLLKFKPLENENDAIVFLPGLKFIEKDQNNKNNNLYQEIKTAREIGKLKVQFDNEKGTLEKDLSKLPKTHFSTEIKAYSKSNNKGWKSSDIDKVVNRIFEEEKRHFILSKIDDGSKKQLSLFNEKEEFVFKNNDTQNLFFLHGAFHIYKDGKRIKKITQQSDKALYDKLQEVLNDEKQEIVCVFQHDDKISAIKNNIYLHNCLQKLRGLSGNLVIIGSSLADNDNHIFEQINNSNIDEVYISTLKEDSDKILEIAKLKLSTKKIFLFEARTISYKISQGLE